MDDPDPFRSVKDFRDWVGLPWDLLWEIFDRVGSFYLLVSAQSVCRQWWRLAHEPRILRRLHISELGPCEFAYSIPECNLLNIGLASIHCWNPEKEEGIGEIYCSKLLLEMRLCLKQL